MTTDVPDDASAASTPQAEDVSTSPQKTSSRGRPRRKEAGSPRDEVKEEAPARLVYSSDDDSGDVPSRDGSSSSPADRSEEESSAGKSIFPPKPTDLKSTDAEGGESSQAERVSERPEQEARQAGSSSGQGQGDRSHSGGGHPFSKRDRFNKKKKKKGGGPPVGGSQPPWKQGRSEKILRKDIVRIDGVPVEWDRDLELGNLPADPVFEDIGRMAELAPPVSDGEAVVDFRALYALALPDLWQEARQREITRESFSSAPSRRQLLQSILRRAEVSGEAIVVTGILEILDDGYGLLTYPEDSYRLKPLNTFVPEVMLQTFGLQRGHEVRMQVIAPREDETCLVPCRILSVMGMEPEAVQNLVPFTELTPYYPTSRIILETEEAKPNDSLSMRIVDLISPVGFGQRGLIVAPPRTGKTVLLQGMAHALAEANTQAHLIVLLIDERPEEVTDFKRHVDAEIISSTFDENAESHVHCAEIVIEKARRMVEAGQHVVILLDSITRLARAYNTLMPNSGKILSGGVEAGALQKPKRFFGSARNIEGAGSLTIMGTALVETGSKMDEVIFEEFKGTGNMELHLDRGLSDKRIFPALSMDRSGTRKEELLYHPDEMAKVYALRRAMKGIPPNEAMEMLIQRVKKTKTNIEFLMTLNR